MLPWKLPSNGSKLPSNGSKLPCYFNPRKSRVKSTAVIYHGIVLYHWPLVWVLAIFEPSLSGLIVRCSTTVLPPPTGIEDKLLITKIPQRNQENNQNVESFLQIILPGKTYWREMLSTIGPLSLTSLNQLLFILKIFFSFFKKTS
jgi:hypothetical protein